MYYIGISETDGNKMIYYCRNCGFKDYETPQEGTTVLKTQMKKTGQSFNHMINEYTKMDPTLPRIYNMKCPNESCITNQVDHEQKEGDKTPAEIIYIRYDDIQMKYLYICVNCNVNWKTDEHK
jgi:DNA-directed RNA polymerase subunit M/transcription elongation factor TFIIS